MPARAVLDAVRPYGLIAVDTRGLSEVTVTHASRTIAADDIEQRIVGALIARYNLGKAENLKITFDRDVRPIELALTSTSELSLVAHQLRHADAPLRRELRAAGRIAHSVALHRHGGRDDRGRGADARAQPRRHPQGERLRDRAPSEERVHERAAGAPPRRSPGLRRAASVRVGQPLRNADLMKPEIVQKNDMVMLHYEVPGIVLTMRGKALESGTEGDMVNVLNVNSKRTIQGIVTGPGRVTVLAPKAARLAAVIRMNPKTRVSAMSNRPRLPATLATLLATGLLANCSALDRLKNVGEKPELSAIENPTAQPGYKPVQMPMPAPQPAVYNPNSLWRNGSRAFFKDQRAMQVGDIMTVKVKITDNAKFENGTARSRTSKEDSGVTDFIGSKLLTGDAAKLMPGKILTTDSTSATDNKGSVNRRAERQEALLTNVAAVVTQVLPNGNLVVEGKQEVRVNFEVRELIVAGIVRPEDIESDNTIDSTKIAQARIAYGGRGQITDVQQPRYGQQVMDILLPF